MSATPPWDLDAQAPDVAVLLWSAEAFAAISRDREWFPRKTEHGEYEYFWVDPRSGYRCVAAFMSFESRGASNSVIRHIVEWHPAVIVNIGTQSVDMGVVLSSGGEVLIPSQVLGGGLNVIYAAPKELFAEIKHLEFTRRSELEAWSEARPTIRTNTSIHRPDLTLEYSITAITKALHSEPRDPTVLLILATELFPDPNATATRKAFDALRLLMYLNLLPRVAPRYSLPPAKPQAALAPSTTIRAHRLEIRNLRCFSTLDIEFGRDDAPTDWTVLLGNNAAGKSTILRILALALTPNAELGAMLHADKDQGWAGPEGPRGEVTLTLVVDGAPKRRTLKLASEGRSTTFELAGDDFDGLPLLLAGYGAARQLQGTKELSDDYSLRDSTATLMEPNGSLQNPELAVRRVAAASDARKVLERLDDILLLEPGSTQLGTSLQVRGPDGVPRPLAQLSDGYRSTLAWVTDFIGWQLMASHSHGRSEVPTIVIVDELEQHLHPSWQRVVIARLRKQFPNVQFIVSTHAPLCVLGTTNLLDDEVSLAYVERGRDADGKSWSIARSGMLPPRGKRADQVLTSYLFGLSSTRDDETDRNIVELSRLRSLPDPSDEDRERMLELQRQLEPLIGSAETELQQEVQQAALEAAERAVKRKLEQLTPQERERILGKLAID